MAISVVKFTTKEKELFELARKVRNIVFIEEQKVSKEEEFDGLDDEAIHYLVYFNNEVAATGRRRKTKQGHKLERFAVYKKHRGKYIGAKLLEAMLNDLTSTEETIYLYAQLSAQKFYAKYKFISEGNVFVEAEIDHIKMVYKP